MRATAKAARVTGDGGRGYKDEDDEGHDGNFPEGGERQWSSSGGKGTKQSNIKSTSTARKVVATTVHSVGFPPDSDGSWPKVTIRKKCESLKHLHAL